MQGRSAVAPAWGAGSPSCGCWGLGGGLPVVAGGLAVSGIKGCGHALSPGGSYMLHALTKTDKCQMKPQ